jgi:predicted GIY-YIG superfamily endonuclease
VKPLGELDVLIVDCQTTGATPALGAVLELGWGVVEGGSGTIRQLQAHWIALPRGAFVGSQVRRLTGWGEGEIGATLAPDDAWERLRASTSFAERMPTAIHFAKFELAFLRDWAERFEPRTSFPFEAVCVHTVACRLYPDLPRRSLRALSGFLGYGLDSARRCLGHVEATAHIWQKLVPELATRGIHTWEQLGDWLVTSLSTPPRSRKRRYPLPAARYRTLPDEPGVYRLLRSNGDVLYVGKAASLRKRVASHFASSFSRTERALEMLTQVSDIQVTCTASALEAALLENESIKAMQPPYNVQLVLGDARTWFIDRKLDAVAHTPSETHREGPLPSTFAARAFGAVLRVASGEEATRALRARAVGAPERFAPGEEVFAEGFAIFSERHELGHAADSEAGRATVTTAASSEAECARSQSQVRTLLVTAARTLILANRADPSRLDGEPENDDSEGGASNTSELRPWDRDRVVRHLERGVLHGYRLLQRARWLRLLYDSVVVFREPGSDRSRLIWVRSGQLAEARDVLAGEPAARLVPTMPLGRRKGTFDRSQYDRLRTLTSELKRVLRDGGTAAVSVGPSRWLTGQQLDRLLLWV